MRMLNLDAKDAKEMTEIVQKEAYQFLKDGIHIICRVSPREFQEVFSVQELDGLVRLKMMGIYNALQYYKLE